MLVAVKPAEHKEPLTNTAEPPRVANTDVRSSQRGAARTVAKQCWHAPEIEETFILRAWAASHGKAHRSGSAESHHLSNTLPLGGEVNSNHALEVSQYAWSSKKCPKVLIRLRLNACPCIRCSRAPLRLPQWKISRL